MARLFDDAASDYLQVQSAPVTEPPFSVALWFRFDEEINGQTMFFLGDSTSPLDYWILNVNSGTPTINWLVAASDNPAGVSSSTAGTINTWHHACAVEAATNSRSVYLDGAGKQSDTTSRVPATPVRTSIGRRGDSTPTHYFSGDIAHVAIWNVALTDAQVAQLAAGACPNEIASSSLVSYWPITGEATEYDRVGDADLTTVQGTVASADPSNGPGGCYPLAGGSRRLMKPVRRGLRLNTYTLRPVRTGLRK